MVAKRKIICRYCRKHFERECIKEHLKECKKKHIIKELDELKNIILQKAIYYKDEQLVNTIKYIIKNRENLSLKPNNQL